MRIQQGTRLLGSIEIGRGDALGFGEANKLFRQELVKVNSDGPMLNLTAAFSISTSREYVAEIPGVMMGSINNREIARSLQAMYPDPRRNVQRSYRELWLIHERVLFSAEGSSRSNLLDVLGYICAEQWEVSHVIDMLNQAVCAYEDAGRDGLADPNYLVGLGTALFHRFEQCGEASDITKSVNAMEDAVLFTPDGPERPSRLNNLAAALCSRFERCGDLDDLNRSVSIGEDALHLTANGDPNKAFTYNTLGNSLYARFVRKGNLDDLNRSVLMGEEAVRLTPDGDPQRPKRLNNLANFLQTRFERFGDLDDINRSVLMGENAVRLTADGRRDRAFMCNTLGIALWRRFQQLGDLNDLNRSITVEEEAVRLTQKGHPQMPIRLNNLSNSLCTRFERHGDQNDLNRSISTGEDALQLVPEDHPPKSSICYDLAISLRRRFEHLGQPDDLNRSICMLEDVLQSSNRPTGNARNFFSLGQSLMDRFMRSGNLDDLNRCISITEDAVQSTPDNSRDKLLMSENLGGHLWRRFEQLGNPDDLNRSISLLEDAVQRTPNPQPSKASAMNTLGNSLRARFWRFGDLGDINRAVVMGEKSVHLTPNGHPDKPLRFTNLGNSFVGRFQRIGDLKDLNSALLRTENAVYLTPDKHPEKPSRLTNLGSLLNIRFERLGEQNDLNRSISVADNAVQLTPDGHPHKPSRLHNLSNALFRRASQLGDPDDIKRSVSTGKEAVHLTPVGHPNKPVTLFNLGNALLCSFERLRDRDGLLQAISMFTLAACSKTGPAHIRFNAALLWAKCAKVTGHSSLLDAYEIAVGLLPELAWLGLSITDRHHHISMAGQAVRDAAAAAIASGQPERALEWLEQGRSIIWGQFLNLRSPIDMLTDKHPALATRLLSLSAQLDGSGTRTTQSHLDMDSFVSQEALPAIANRAHQAAHEREELLKIIHGLEGFSQFLLPKKFSQLSEAAQNGPVVVLNVSTERCDALIIMSGLGDEVMHISLPDFTPADAKGLTIALSSLVGRGLRLYGRRERGLNRENQFEQTLSKLWLGVVRPVLHGMAITTPTANLSRLYGKDDVLGSKLSDFIISSYTPSLTALIESLRAPSKSQKALKLLAVAQPAALRQSLIPGTQQELNHIQRIAQGKVPILRLEENTATLERVQRGMRDSRWVHFACHGVQDVFHPTNSALLLARGSRLTLSSIIELALPHADLAFLSACQTATGDKQLEEESVHLAAGMLLAGYRGVIATMWTIMDNDAPEVASDVYEHLFKASPPDPSKAAEALHLAIQKLRHASHENKSFFHWVPFIHIGA
ncbi:CHAT domain-containing protein [Mycena crocata]|nr:CHAT domain-containing protein [Mycena crocata]